MRRAALFFGLFALTSCSLFESADHKYVVFFPTESSDLDASAENVVAQVAQRMKDHPSTRVLVEGHAAVGNTGNLSSEEMLAIERTKVVAHKLVEDGVSGDRITQNPRAPASHGASVAARRVDIKVVD